MSASDTAKFTVNPVNDPPVMTDIPDQTIDKGKTFTAIKLDDYLSDPDNADSEIVWKYNGNIHLSVSISDDHIANIAILYTEWIGSETITFTGTDPGGLSVSDSTVFTVKPVSIIGDVNNDGEVRSNDAILALRIAVGLTEPTEYQKLTADMNKDGEIRSDDALIILRKAAGLAAPFKNLIEDRHISISLSEAHELKGETISVPIIVDNIDIMSSGDASITYDSKVLRAIDVLSSDNLFMVDNISQSGLIRISFAGIDRLNNGKLVEIDFEVLADDVSPLTFEIAKLYGTDSVPLNSRVINRQFRSWAVAPEHSSLLQNYPNPFNPETWIPYQLKNDS